MDRYLGEYMVPIINIINDIKEPTHGYQNCKTGQILIFSGYPKVREFLYTRVVNLGQHHSEPYLILRRFYTDTKVLAWYQK